MASVPRNKVICENTVGVYHVWSRCVRQSGLFGRRSKNRAERKLWVPQRVSELVQVFAVEACVFAVLSTHYHLLVRNRVDLARQWSDEEVVRRWWQLAPKRKDEHGNAADPTDREIQAMLSKPDQVAKWRRRLSSISWFMKFLNEYIAKRANAEDGVRGHFFDGRFKCRRLLDEAAVMACAIYIDLNEIRAHLANSSEESRNTSAYFRIIAKIKRQLRREAQRAGEQIVISSITAEDPDYWLCPISESDTVPLLGPSGAESVRRSSELLATQTSEQRPAAEIGVQNHGQKFFRHGFLPCDADEYLKLLDWNARRVIPGKSSIEATLPPILTRLGFDSAVWLEMIEHFEEWFFGAVGSAARVEEEAARTGRRWIHGIGRIRASFG